MSSAKKSHVKENAELYAVLGVGALLLLVMCMIGICLSSFLGLSIMNKSNTSSPTKKYVSTSLEECKLILYMCVEGQQPFTDSIGCGCESSNK
jgi:hypothetical protein